MWCPDQAYMTRGVGVPSPGSHPGTGRGGRGHGDGRWRRWRTPHGGRWVPGPAGAAAGAAGAADPHAWMAMTAAAVVRVRDYGRAASRGCSKRRSRKWRSTCDWLPVERVGARGGHPHDDQHHPHDGQDIGRTVCSFPRSQGRGGWGHGGV